MPKKKSVKKVSAKNKKRPLKIKRIPTSPIREVEFPVKNIQAPVKNEINKEIPKTSKFRRFLKKAWFSFGILDFIWTIFWLIYSLNQKDLHSLVSVVFFAVGFYIFCFFILITLIYYIIKMMIRVHNQNA
jgi:hypothetical protein